MRQILTLGAIFLAVTLTAQAQTNNKPYKPVFKAPQSTEASRRRVEESNAKGDRNANRYNKSSSSKSQGTPTKKN